MKSILLEEIIHKKLKVLSAVSGKNIKFLLIEALNLLFKKYQEDLKNGKETM